MKYTAVLALFAAVAFAAPVTEVSDNVEKRACDKKAQSDCILTCQMGCVGLHPAGMSGCIGTCIPSCQEYSGCN